MDFLGLNLEVQTLFEESNEPNMFFPDYRFQQSLENYKPNSLDHHNNIKRMINIIKIIFYLKSNKFNPCQIKYSFVGCDKDHNWGLKHVVCYRTMSPSNNKNNYDNSEFLYHLDQDNELVWNLGKIWLRFYTDKQINVVGGIQFEIDDVIEKSVTERQVNLLQRKMLRVKKEQRISFQQLIEDEIFRQENFQQRLYSLISMQFPMVSVNQKVSNSLNSKVQIKTAYEEEIFRRDLEESLEICFLMEKTIALIRSTYEKSVDIEFHAFVIKAQTYCFLKKIDQKKTSNRVQDYTVHQKKVYFKFVTKMLTLKQELQKQRKMKIFSSDSLNQDQKQFINSTDEMTLQKIHPAFKQIIIGYYLQSVQYLKETVSFKQLNENAKNKKICVAEKRCVIFLLARLFNQIFSELRTHIYSEFLKMQENTQKYYSIKEFLQFIQNWALETMFIAMDFVGLHPITKFKQKSDFSKNNIYLKVFQQK